MSNSLPDGRRLGHDGLVHIYKDGNSLCFKGHKLIIFHNSEATDEQVNCPVCVISARQLMKDLIGPPPKKEVIDHNLQTAMYAHIIALQASRQRQNLQGLQNSIVNIGNSGLGVQNSINFPVHSHLNAQIEAQHTLQEDIVESKSSLGAFLKKLLNK